MTKIAIMQSNYIPWKGYFDLISNVDEFVIYDEVQFTKNDWRNRNIIKTQSGLKWLSIPAGKKISRNINSVKILDHSWKLNHYNLLKINYKGSAFYNEVLDLLEPLYMSNECENLSEINKKFIVKICDYLDIKTNITDSYKYKIFGNRTEKLINICKQARADQYVTGPSAKNYLNEYAFESSKIKLVWFNYDNYVEYKQLWNDKFDNNLSIVDCLFNCGSHKSKYLFRKT